MAASVHNAIRDFVRGFFCVRVPDIIGKLKNKKLPVVTRCLSTFIFRNGR